MGDIWFVLNKILNELIHKEKKTIISFFLFDKSMSRASYKTVALLGDKLADLGVPSNWTSMEHDIFDR